MLIRVIVLTVVFINYISVCANPAPINLELNKATSQDVKNIYKILSQRTSEFGGKEYFLNTSDVDIRQLKEVSVLCDENDIVQGVQFIISKNRFEDVYESLSKKYELISKDIPFVGNKVVRFKDQDSRIILLASHMSFDMQLTYMTDSFLQKIIESSNKENDERKSKEEQAF